MDLHHSKEEHIIHTMDYRRYIFSLKEYILYGSIYVTIAGIVSFMFYRSIYPMALFLPGAAWYFRYIKMLLKRKRDLKLTLQFKDFINTLSSLLSTGHSLENAIVKSKKELVSLYGNSMIVSELEHMCKKLMLHVPPEDIFMDFAMRTDIEHIKSFSEILSIAKRSGGDLVGIILSTSASISTQIEIQHEIEINLSGRKYELYIMSVMPLLIMCYVKATQPGFFNPVYGNPAGIIIMSVCLLLYGAAIFMAHHILSD